MTEPESPQVSPYPIDVEEKKAYFWCACGRSKNQPFCDGSHKETEFVPVKYTAKRNQTVFFCGCKRSKLAPICDGSHKALN